MHGSIARIGGIKKLQEKVYYAVARGHKPGVYETWAECQEQTKDFKGAKFKKFTEEEEAKLFAEGKTLKQIGAQFFSSLTPFQEYKEWRPMVYWA